MLGAENQLMQVYELGAENNSLGAENNPGQTVHIVHFSRGCLPLELAVDCPGLRRCPCTGLSSS